MIRLFLPMQYTATLSPQAGHASGHRLYDALMRHIDLDLTTWNYTSFKLHLLTLSPAEQKSICAAKQASLTSYRKHLIQLEQNLGHRDQTGTREMMQAGGDLDELSRVEHDIHNL